MPGPGPSLKWDEATLIETSQKVNRLAHEMRTMSRFYDSADTGTHANAWRAKREFIPRNTLSNALGAGGGVTSLRNGVDRQ